MRTTVLRHLLPMMLLLAFAQGAAYAQDRLIRGGVIYEFVQAGDNSAWKCTGYDSSDPSFPTDGVITILSELENVGEHDEPIPVTEIVEWAFNDKNNNVDTEDIHGVVIAEGIKVIGEYAFHRCIGITHLTLPSTIEYVGEGALHCGDGLRWVDCRQVGQTWNQQLSTDDYISIFGVSDYLMNLEYALLYMPSWWTKGETNVVITGASSGSSCQEWHYSRNMDYCIPDGFTAEKITVRQKLAADDGAYSVCLPYSLPIPQGAKAYSLMKRDDTDVCFSQISGDMHPFKPYLIVASEEVTLDCGEQREILTTEAAEALLTSDQANRVTLRGTFRRINYDVASAGSFYVLQSENLWKRVGGGYTHVGVSPFRVYLTLDASGAASVQTTLIDGTDAIALPVAPQAAAHAKNAWHTLQGQRLSAAPSQPGIYIHQGKKVVIER